MPCSDAGDAPELIETFSFTDDLEAPFGPGGYAISAYDDFPDNFRRTSSILYDNKREIDPQEAAICRALGKRLAEVGTKLQKG